MSNGEIDQLIFGIIKRLAIEKDTNGLRFDPEIKVECKDNEKEYVDYLAYIFYDGINNIYKMTDKNGNKIPFVFLKNPEIVLKKLTEIVKMYYYDK